MDLHVFMGHLHTAFTINRAMRAIGSSVPITLTSRGLMATGHASKVLEGAAEPGGDKRRRDASH